MSEEIIKEANRVVWWWDTMYIGTTGETEYPDDYLKKFLQSMNEFREARVGGDTRKISKAALLVMKLYNLCLRDDLISVDNSKALNSLQYYKNESEKLEKQVSALKEQLAKERAESEKKYDELLSQYSVMKGQFEECTKRLDQIILGGGFKE
jgi:hypothetical protein